MWLDLVAVPLLAKLCLVGMFPLSAFDKVAHWNEAKQQASSGPLPDPSLLLVVGKREAEEGTVALRRLGSEERQVVISLDTALEMIAAEAVAPDLAAKPN